MASRLPSMSSSRRPLVMLVVLVLALTHVSLAIASQDTVSLSGVVTDQGAGSIADANVTLMAGPASFDQRGLTATAATGSTAFNRAPTPFGSPRQDFSSRSDASR